MRLSFIHPAARVAAGIAVAALLASPDAGSAQVARDTTSAARDTARTARDTVQAVPLREIVVTATKLPLPAGASGAAVTVLAGDDMRERGVRRVVDALRAVPGIAVAQLGGTGAVASLFMRGSESDHVQVLIDGVQVNDPGGSFDWAHLTTDDVERIEIVRGPVSVLYGSDAIGGVVQIFTRGGGDVGARSGGNASARGEAHSLVMRAQVIGGHGTRVGPEANGGYGALDANGSISGSAPLRGMSLGYAATASQVTSDGAYAYNNQYENRTFSGRLALRAGTAWDAGITARLVDQRFHYPTSGGGLLVDRNQFTDGRSLTLGASGGFHIAPRLETRVQLASHRSQTGGGNPADQEGDGFSNSTADVQRRTAEVRMNAFLPRDVTATVGIEAERQEGSTTFDSDGPFGPYNSASNDARSNVGYYAQLIAAPLQRFTFTVGLRLDDNEQYGTFTTGRIAAALQLSRALRLRAAHGNGFREPTFLEAYATGFAVGDPDLQPEYSTSSEIGADVSHGVASAGVTIFSQRLRDLIQYSFTAAPGTPNYFNIGRARTQGVELTAAVRLPADVSLSGSYSYVDSEVTDEGFGEDRSFLEGMRLLRRPVHQASATAAAQIATNLDGSLSVIYSGERDDLDFTDPADFSGRRTVLPAYTTLDASLTWRVPLRLSLRPALLVRATNLLDDRHDEVFNFPAAGRMLWLGVTLESGGGSR